MEELINQFIQFGRENIFLAYGVLFLSAFIENVFPPVPGDTVTLIGAYFVGTGTLEFTWVLVSTTAGSTAGFVTLFFIAYRLGWAFFERKQFRWMKKSRLQKVDNWINRYGYRLILANRFLTGIRSLISVSAGLSHLNIWIVTGLSFVSALLWNAIVIYLGAFIGQSWQEIERYINLYNQVIIGLLILIAAVYAVYYFAYKRKKVKS